MRTTVTLDPDVERLVKTAMRQRDASFKEVVNDSLRQALGSGALPVREPYRQPTFSMGRPLVDLTKATALAADLEDQTLIERLRTGP